MPQPEITAYYEALAKKYDEDRFGNSYGRFIDASERKILEKLLVNPDEIVLDLACGSGRFLNFAQIGIDASAEMIEVAKTKFPNKIFKVADAENTGLADASIDAITIFHLFMHLDQPKMDAILSECHRILKPNGRVIFDIPSQKRRKLLGYKGQNWHGAYGSTLKEVGKIGGFEAKRSFGILFLPIHRLPKKLRPAFAKLDSLLSNSIFKEFSSYLIIEFQKR